MQENNIKSTTVAEIHAIREILAEYWRNHP